MLEDLLTSDFSNDATMRPFPVIADEESARHTFVMAEDGTDYSVRCQLRWLFQVEKHRSAIPFQFCV